MKHIYWLYDLPVINPTECDSFITENLSILTSGRVGKGDIEISARRTNVCSPSETHNNVLEDLIKQANNNAFGFDVSGCIETQLVEYLAEDKGFYDYHIDSKLCDADGMVDRKLTCIIMLSDQSDFTGGELMIGNKEIILNKGCALVFPSFLTHKVNPVTSGRRYTLVAWQYGLHWR